MRLSYPPVRVHIWGGLGSQLYAWAILISLQEKFPRRRLVAVFHNGGVTKRESELNPYIQDIPKEFVRDYLSASEEKYISRSRKRLSLVSLGLLRIPLRALGFIAGANNDKDFSKLRPWVLSLRGHYSNRKISSQVSSIIENALFRNLSLQFLALDDAELAVHYRLGDLLHLKSKTPLDINTLVFGIMKAKMANQKLISPMFVCSDSIEIAISNLSIHFQSKNLRPVYLKPRETIYFLMNVPFFIGSPSKISEWVTIFRVNSGKAFPTFLPQQMSTQLCAILDETELIHYF